jgi:hypothetical protein
MEEGSLDSFLENQRHCESVGRCFSLPFSEVLGKNVSGSSWQGRVGGRIRTETRTSLMGFMFRVKRLSV